jgi:hypothetical protein
MKISQIEKNHISIIAYKNKYKQKPYMVKTNTIGKVNKISKAMLNTQIKGKKYRGRPIHQPTVSNTIVHNKSNILIHNTLENNNQTNYELDNLYQLDYNYILHLENKIQNYCLFINT